MLPSSHLALFEGPGEAARRLLAEQLSVEGLPLEGPRVVSETYRRERPARDPHWDLHFLFEGTWPAGRPLAHPHWLELAFVDSVKTPPERFARGHGDVLALGARVRAPPT